MIGDPTGKSAERNLLDEATIQTNIRGIRSQLERFLDFSPDRPNRARILNNYDWLKDYNFLDFIRDNGKHLTVNYMLAKDSVQKRLEYGLSFTEFCYQLIQGFDFYYLNQHHQVDLQAGGADQWGNITTGTEIIRRKGGRDVFAFTCPLLKKADGGKFGKTESGNVWLDRNKTSPYKFYQFWLNVSDEDAAQFIRLFTFLPLEEISELIDSHLAAPERRQLQKKLAEELTVMVHGRADLESAMQASEILFGKSTTAALLQLDEQQLLEIMEGVPRISVPKASLENQVLVDFLTANGVFTSKGEARKLIQAGGFSINKEKVADPGILLSSGMLLNGKYLLFQKGKKQYYLAVFE